MFDLLRHRGDEWCKTARGNYVRGRVPRPLAADSPDDPVGGVCGAEQNSRPDAVLGAAANDLMLQFQADILGISIVRPTVTETTALGASFLAGLAVGFWSGLDDLRDNWTIDHRFEPTMSIDEAQSRRARWAEAIRRARNWESPVAPDA